MTTENKTNDMPADKQTALDEFDDMAEKLSRGFSPNQARLNRIRAALTAPQPKFNSSFYNEAADELEFLAEDCTTITEPVDRFISKLRKNGTGEIVGFKIHGPEGFIQHVIEQPVADLEGLKREASKLKTVYVSGSIHGGEIIADRERFIDHLHATGRLNTADTKALWDCVIVQETNEQKETFMQNWLRGQIKIPEHVRLRIVHGSPEVEALKDAVRDLDEQVQMYVDVEEGPTFKSHAQIKHAPTIAKVKGE